MKNTPQNQAPADADDRRAVKPVICYPTDTLPVPDMATYAKVKAAEDSDEGEAIESKLLTRQIEKAQRWFQRFGFWSLLLAWAPIFGDALTLIAGIMRVRLGLFLLLVGA